MTYQQMLFPQYRDKAFTMSYDDGIRQDIRLIEIMTRYGLRGTFNLNSGLMEGKNRIKPDEVCDVYLKTGNEVALHGAKHLSLTAIGEDRVIDEIFNDRKALEAMTGTLVKGMAYANGNYDDKVVGLLEKCGVLYARTTVSTGNFKINDDWLRLTATCHHNDERLFELADKFLSAEKHWYFWSNHPKLFYLWGHSYEFDNDGTWGRIEKFAEKIGNREDVWYATNGEIVRYVKAFQALEYSADGSKVYNPTALDVYMQTVDGKRVKIAAGERVTI